MRYRRAAAASTLVPLAFALVGLAGWTTGRLRLASLHTEFIPMAPGTAVAFLLVSSALLAVTLGLGRATRHAVRAAALVVLALAFIELIEFLAGITVFKWEEALILRAGTFGAVPLAHMSPLTAATLALVGLALGCLTSTRSPARSPAARDLCGVLGSLSLLMGSTVALGYAYGAPLLYGGSVIPMALTTGLSFVGTGVALVALAGPASLPLRPFFRNAERAERAETRNRELQDRSTYALAVAGAGIWDMDYTTGVLQWSEILESQYGLQPGTFGGTFEAFVERLHPDDRASVLETIGRAVKSGADFSLQHRSIWPDGTVRWLSSTGRILLGKHGEPLRGIGISLDITDRHTLEMQFQQAQKMEAVGQLAGGVAHDFNNLLTVILGFCELLLADRDPDDPRQADIEEVQKAAMRAAELTRQLLAFSRKQIIEPTLLDLNVVVTGMWAMLGRLIGADVKIVLGLRPELAFVKADRGQVEQVVMNLAINARDAMATGGTLTIATANVELDEHYTKTHLAVKPGPYVALTVTDTGTGMTPQVQARLFEPFFTTKGPGKGTGLGLATVYGIVAQSGGSVGVYSEVGRGTSVKVYFPRAAVSGTIVNAPAPAARPSAAGTQTVLVVEDEGGLRELARRLLQRLGYTVLVAADADEALRLFEQNRAIDLLLTDVVMPGASGPELTRRLLEQRPALKVIYMSGYTEEAIVQHGIIKPGIAFLDKPFTSETLGQKVREVLDQ